MKKNNYKPFTEYEEEGKLLEKDRLIMDICKIAKRFMTGLNYEMFKIEVIKCLTKTK